MTKDTQAQKFLILQSALKLIPMLGWSDQMLEQASLDAGFSKEYGKLLLVGGVKELIELYFQQINDAMLTRFATEDTNKLGISAKIKLALKIRIQVLASYKKVVAKTSSYLSMPWNITFGLKLSWQVVDLIWRELASDASHDFNYYTKRGLLLAVYGASIQFFLSDTSKNHKDTESFIDRRINDVLKIGKFVSKFK
ncbi:MAG: rpsU-divergently transcribed protein [Candidatus Midichloriaceae bacterium]|jgi:ubiquinone biosynthesis protein COQ9|nr:rpsU-divergently transcribed protein [Candidatus Midichloriaceae bacterium]